MDLWNSDYLKLHQTAGQDEVQNQQKRTTCTMKKSAARYRLVKCSRFDKWHFVYRRRDALCYQRYRFDRSCKVTQHYPYLTNSLYKLLIRPVLTYAAPFGAIHRLLTIVNFKFFNPNVFESLVIISEAPLSHTYTPLLTLNSFTSLFTVWLIKFCTTVQLTPTLSSVK